MSYIYCDTCKKDQPVYVSEDSPEHGTEKVYNLCCTECNRVLETKTDSNFE